MFHRSKVRKSSWTQSCLTRFAFFFSQYIIFPWTCKLFAVLCSWCTSRKREFIGNFLRSATEQMSNFFNLYSSSDVCSPWNVTMNATHQVEVSKELLRLCSAAANRTNVISTSHRATATTLDSTPAHLWAQLCSTSTLRVKVIHERGIVNLTIPLRHQLPQHLIWACMWIASFDFQSTSTVVQLNNSSSCEEIVVLSTSSW